MQKHNNKDQQYVKVHLCIKLTWYFVYLYIYYATMVIIDYIS